MKPQIPFIPILVALLLVESSMSIDAQSNLSQQPTALASGFEPGPKWLDTSGTPINAHGGGILFYDRIYYWFGEHKIAGKAGNSAHVGVHVYSSKDLYQWRDEGIALSVSTDPGSDIAKGCILERPKVVFNPLTKKFVMWFHLELLGKGYVSARAGVAVADKVTGPYSFVGSFRPDAGALPINGSEDLKKPLSAEQAAALAKSLGESGNGNPDEIFRRDFPGGQMSRDMTLFVDDDGKAYQIYASEENQTLHISQLSDDFLKSAGKFIRIFPGDFNEAPALFKAKGSYYLITSGCAGWEPNDARLFRAKSIWGLWEKIGNPCRGTPQQVARTFDSQSTFVIPSAWTKGEYVFMADRWNPNDAIDGRYVWLPVQFTQDGNVFLEWRSPWKLTAWDAKPLP
jgi:hypothetical protein